MNYLPPELTAVFDKFEGSDQPYGERDVASEIEKTIQSLPTSEHPLKPEVLAECMAFDFFPDNRSKGNSWGTYYGPLLVAEVDGVRHERPSLSRVSTEMLNYWAHRSVEARSPLLQNRYADLVWDFSSLVTGKGASINHAMCTIKSALELANRELARHPFDCRMKLARALSVALSINNSDLIRDCAQAIMRLEKKSAELSKLGSWGFSFELLIENKKVALTADERNEIIAELEAKLALASEIQAESGIPRDPYASERVTLLLARHYERNERIEDRRRVLSLFTQMSISFAMKTSALVGVNWLRRVFDLLVKYGMTLESQKVALALQQIGPNVKGEMSVFSTDMVITDEEKVDFQNKILKGTAEEASSQIIACFIPRQERVVRELQDWAESAPLSFLIPRGILDERGRTVATIGSVEEDIDGREVQLISQTLQLQWPFLNFALEGWIDRFQLSPEKVLERIMLSPAFLPERRHILLRGLEAYFQGDHCTAAHLFIPQIENAFRHILETAGRPVFKLGRHGGMNLRTLDDCLVDPLTKKILGSDVVRYLRILLTDPRGYNMRNNYCHGLIHVPQDQSVHTDRLVHVLLILSALRLASQSEPAVEKPGPSNQ